ncbi:LysR family transcriptional regulator [Defluviitalea raffinosedens]|uniref:LysR family transcriptional regulator n=1 Tax=Defluviitalea raffinosedens TaxID=1450156 RepID=A0A7C8LKA2_9FIRM|nr:LysR family transcriptional regulator [Defluviitalea raffinosedens]
MEHLLDIRVDTFLSVCKNKSYTKAAEALNITQPAVTQHIQFLERHYGCKFFEYVNRGLKLTEEGELFYKHILQAKGSDQFIIRKLEEIGQEKKTLSFAATMTIGEFTLAPVLSDFVKTFSDYDITMYVDNTKTVLKMLMEGKILFAIVEGLFNKAEYETQLYKMSNFILVASAEDPIASKEGIYLDDLKDQTIIIREKGSGSREVLERGLFDRNYTLGSFKKIIEIGNVNVAKALIKSRVGLGFMYEDAVKEEIKKGELMEVKLKDFALRREFNFVCMKNEIIKDEVKKFWDYFSKKEFGA